MPARTLNEQTYKEARRLYMEGTPLSKIAKKLDVSTATLRKYEKAGAPERGIRPWQQARADMVRASEQIGDEELSKDIALARNISKTVLSKAFQNLIKKFENDPDFQRKLSMMDISMILRENTQLLRLGLDAVRPPKGTQINVAAQAGAQINQNGVSTGSRIALSTVRALQEASDDELSAIEKFQRRYTTDLENTKRLPAPRDVIDADDLSVDVEDD